MSLFRKKARASRPGNIKKLSIILLTVCAPADGRWRVGEVDFGREIVTVLY
jgi:hypothetical protein